MNLFGDSHDPNVAGVHGTNTAQGGVGVAGVSTSGDGVRAVSQTGNGLSAFSATGTAVFGRGAVNGGYFEGTGGAVGATGISTSGDGLRAVSQAGNGLSAFSTSGTGVYAKGAVNAGYFEGNVTVTGDIQFTAGADCAEQFDVAPVAGIEPGSVLVIGEDGALLPCTLAYDSRVAGVVSGAGPLRPAILLDNTGGQGRMPVALVGKVMCKVDASFGAVAVGDLLTTSPMPGHAMKATDRERAFGAVIGKALRSLDQGRGLVPIMATLQ